MNAIGHVKNERYNQFKSFLQRAKTFNHLIFYNRRLVSQYTLASYGFKMAKGRDAQSEARCCDCGLGFRLDPLIQVQTMELKQNINQALMNHQDQCKFNFRRKNHRQNVKLNQQTIIQFGVLLYLQIFSSNNYHLQTISEFIKQQKQENLLGQKFFKLFQTFTKNDLNSKSIILTSLFGWRIINNEIKCEYCGANETSPVRFNLFQSHKSYCAIIRQNYWQIILSKLTTNKLQSIDGQFLKTKGQLKAKQLRQQLQKSSCKVLNSIQNFKLKIKSIKNDLENLDTQENSPQLVVKTRLNHLDNFAEQMLQYIKKSVKKVKIE